MSWLFLALIAGNLAKAELPFWRAKERVYERIQSREIIVSVKNKKASADKKNQLTISGGGQVSAPCDFVFKAAQDYEKVALASGYVERAQYKDQTLKVTLAAYGYRSNLEIEVKAGEARDLNFKILKGPMHGMAGKFDFITTSKPKRCDVGIEGEYTYASFPVPEFFLRFGMEVMLQRMAGRIRAYAEERFSEKGVNDEA